MHASSDRDALVRRKGRRGRIGVLAGMIVAALALGAFAVPTAGAAPRAAAAKCPDPSGSVKVGITFFGSVAAAGAAIGGDTSQAPADTASINALKAGVTALNDAGGIAGCTVEALVYNFPALSPDFNQESQKECTFFTQDNKVVAVYGGAYETKVAVDCYAKAKVPFFSGIVGKYTPSCDDLKKYAGIVWLTAGVGSCRFGAMVPLWNKAGLFPKDANVGILVSDDGTGQAAYVANKLYAPALKKLKIPYTMFTYHQSTSLQDFANTSASMAAALLKFKSENVNVVLWTPAGSSGPSTFLPQAANQGYFPSYGYTTNDAMVNATTIGAEAVKSAIGISWLITDLSFTEQQALPANEARTECAAWANPQTANLALPGASSYCDFLHLMQVGWTGAKKIDQPTLAKNLNALGTSFDSSVTYDGATKFATGQYGNAIDAQILKIDPAKKAWVYANSSSQKPVTIP